MDKQRRVNNVTVSGLEVDTSDVGDLRDCMTNFMKESLEVEVNFTQDWEEGIFGKVG